jgi:hypothetical protein
METYFFIPVKNRFFMLEILLLIVFEVYWLKKKHAPPPTHSNYIRPILHVIFPAKTSKYNFPFSFIITCKSILQDK